MLEIIISWGRYDEVSVESEFSEVLIREDVVGNDLIWLVCLNLRIKEGIVGGVEGGF